MTQYLHFCVFTKEKWKSMYIYCNFFHNTTKLETSFFFFWWPCHVACRILICQPGIESRPSAVKAWRPNHQTAREFPWNAFCLISCFNYAFMFCQNLGSIDFNLFCLWKMATVKSDLMSDFLSSNQLLHSNLLFVRKSNFIPPHHFIVNIFMHTEKMSKL